MSCCTNTPDPDSSTVNTVPAPNTESPSSDTSTSPNIHSKLATQSTHCISKQADNLSLLSSKPSDKEELIPVPPAHPKGGVSILAHKLWIGNLDKRLTEQNILRFVTQYGRVVSFRFLFKGGSERVEPRGYVFVEYSNREEAETAKAALDGKKALGKRITVDWAKADQGVTKSKSPHTVSETWDASAVSKTLDGRASTTSKIAILEAKLRQMEETDLGGPVKRQRLSGAHRHTVVAGVSNKRRTRPVC